MQASAACDACLSFDEDRCDRSAGKLRGQFSLLATSAVYCFAALKMPLAHIFPVGCGKTLIMDQFFVTITVKRKRRTHFHTQAITSAIDDIVETTQLLCFGEFSIDDVADAMML